VPGTLTLGVAPYKMLYEKARMSGVATSVNGAERSWIQIVVGGNEASKRLVPKLRTTEIWWHIASGTACGTVQ